jgi:hypothetical protein
MITEWLDFQPGKGKTTSSYREWTTAVRHIDGQLSEGLAKNQILFQSNLNIHNFNAFETFSFTLLFWKISRFCFNGFQYSSSIIVSTIHRKY